MYSARLLYTNIVSWQVGIWVSCRSQYLPSAFSFPSCLHRPVPIKVLSAANCLRGCKWAWVCPSTRPRTAVTTMDRSQQRQGLWPSIFSSSGSRRDWSRSKAATIHRCQLGSVKRFHDPFNNIYKTATESQESSTVATCPEKYMNDKNKDILCSLWNEYQVIAYKTSEPFMIILFEDAAAKSRPEWWSYDQSSICQMQYWRGWQ